MKSDKKDPLGGLRKALRRRMRETPRFKGLEPVFGEGPVPSAVVVAGEAPGRAEAMEGRPFVGRSGGFFVTLLEEVFERPREELYLTNVVKVWPREGSGTGRTRSPKKSEVDFFVPFFLKEMEIVSPRVIVAAGRCAFSALVPEGEFTPGEWALSGIAGEGGQTVPVMPVYHPSYVLRFQNNRGGVEKLRAQLREARKKAGV